jgi:hypothetical protein
MGSFSKGFERAQAVQDQIDAEARQKANLSRLRIDDLKKLVDADAATLSSLNLAVTVLPEPHTAQLQLSHNNQLVAWVDFDKKKGGYIVRSAEGASVSTFPDSQAAAEALGELAHRQVNK